VEDTPVRTAIVESRDIFGTLVATSLIDLLDDGAPGSSSRAEFPRGIRTRPSRVAWTGSS
ncbi:MAG TPA: hypothetical protein VLV54_18915, partial [Thermoanaerobaculia bacterium]|nr:hypothetical protein [Thermoanaerobaculia bacterium]